MRLLRASNHNLRQAAFHSTCLHEEQRECEIPHWPTKIYIIRRQRRERESKNHNFQVALLEESHFPIMMSARRARPPLCHLSTEAACGKR
jgi:hypothetical protein